MEKKPYNSLERGKRKLEYIVKYILIIGDGMADNPVPELHGKTPLDAAEKPFLDYLASRSQVGSVLTVPPSMPPGSDTAILSIFGCDPCRYYTGRSPLEAAGCGACVPAGYAGFRCNMVCLEDGDQPFGMKKIISHNAGSIDGDTSVAVITQLCADPEFRDAMEALGMQITPTPSFRHIAMQKDGELDGIVMTPPHDILGKAIGDYAFCGNENAQRIWALMELANRKLDHLPVNEKRRKEGKLPANGIWFWAEGTAVELPSFPEVYGHTGSVISAVPLVHGIGVLSGLRMITVEGATGEVDTNYAGKLQAAKDALLSGDEFLCLHLEAPDESTHNGSLSDKLLAIRQMDSLIVEPLVHWMEQQKMAHRILLLSDHKTLMSTKTHDGDPVPYLLYDSTKPQTGDRRYTETDGEQGPYIECGTALMALLFDHNNELLKGEET